MAPSFSAAQATPPDSTSLSLSSADLKKVLAEMNAASAQFKSAQAEFKWDTYQAVVQDHDIQTGVIYFARKANITRMAGYFKAVASQGESKVVVYDGSQLQFYQPAIKQMQIFRAGSNSSQYESFLTLGFGGSGSDLEKTWDVALLGHETIDGIAVAKLDLKPRTQSVQNLFSHVTIWVDPSRGISLKQVFYEPSGDQRTCTYTDIKSNQPIPENIFHIKTAPGTTVQVR